MKFTNMKLKENVLGHEMTDLCTWHSMNHEHLTSYNQSMSHTLSPNSM